MYCRYKGINLKLKKKQLVSTQVLQDSFILLIFKGKPGSN